MKSQIRISVLVYFLLFTSIGFSQGPSGMPDFSGHWNLVANSTGNVVGQYTITLVPTGIYITPMENGSFASATQKSWVGSFVWKPESIMFENSSLGFRIMTGSGNYDSMGLDVNGGMNFEYQYKKQANLNPSPSGGAGVSTVSASGSSSVQSSLQTTDLNSAIKAGDLTAVEEILKTNPAGLNTVSEKGTTPLHEAVFRGDDMMVDILLNGGADPNVPATNGKTSLDLAIERGHEGITEIMISRTMDIQISDASLKKVIQTRKTDMIKTLLDHGVDANKTLRLIEPTNNVELFYEIANNYGATVDNAMFESAVNGKRLEMAQAILERGIDSDRALNYCISKKDKVLIPATLAYGANPNPALEFAVREKDSQLAQSAISDYGADPNGVMKLAVENKNGQMVTLLLQNGANPSQQMELAAAQGSDDIVRQFISAGGDANKGLKAAADNKKWSTVEVLVVEGQANPEGAMKQAVDNGNVSVTSTLLNYGANGAKTEYIVSAASQKNAQLVGLLLQNGANPNDAIKTSVGLKDVNIARQLLDAGADPTTPSLIQTSVSQNDMSITQLLIERGADPNHGMLNGCKAGNDNMVGYLINSGADGSAPGLLKNAAPHNNTVLVGHLLNAGADPNEGILPAVNGGAGKVVAQLGENGVPLTNIDYMTTAVNSNYYSVAKALLNGGCDPTTYTSPSGGNYLHVAAGKENFEMVKLLANAGVNPHKADAQDGKTPLHVAVEGKNDNLDMVVFLVSEKNCDVNVMDSKGKSILQTAKGRKVKKYLKDNGAQKKP